MPKTNRYNWEMIKEVYIRGEFDLATGQSLDYSFADICRKFGVKNRSTVKAHADKENWNADREAYKEQLRQTIAKKFKEIAIPSVVEFKRLLINMHTATIRHYMQRLNAGEVEVRPSDARDSGNFLLQEYRYLFDIEEPAKKVEVSIDFKDKDDIYATLARLRNGDDH